MSRGTNNLCFFCVTSFVTNKDFIKSYKKAKVTIDKNIRGGGTIVMSRDKAISLLELFFLYKKENLKKIRRGLDESQKNN